MRHISIFRDDVQPFDSLCISDDVVEEDRAVFLDPAGSYPSELYFRKSKGFAVCIPRQLVVRRSSCCDSLETITGSAS